VDVNGTRFHLILGESDWRACQEPDPDGPNVACRDDDSAHGFIRFQWEERDGVLTLRPILSLFKPDRPGPPLDPEDRRGAGVDRFGNAYWIDQDQEAILWSPPRGRSRVYWAQAPEACPVAADGFGPVPSEPATPDRLAGLAVTEHHYLVVGNLTGHGLLVFDLHAGGSPIRLSFPAGIDFVPFDLAPAPGGGVWVLDRQNKAYWGMDRSFRVVSTPTSLQTVEPAETSAFRPVGGAIVVAPSRRFPRGFPVDAVDPVSIEGLPDGSVLVMDRAVAPGGVASSIRRYALGEPLSEPAALDDEVFVESARGAECRHLGIVGHDLAYVPELPGTDGGRGSLFVVDDDGTQVVAFALSCSSGELAVRAQIEYLPLHAYGGRALVAATTDGVEAQVFYDLARGDRTSDSSVRWATVQPIEQPRYVSAGRLLLGAARGVAGEIPHFDGKVSGCVWHRLFLDACMPPESSVEVWSRAADAVEALESTPFVAEPTPYLRAAGPELPFQEPFAAAGETSALGSVGTRTYSQSGQASSRGEVGRDAIGTWETLFQAARGRYLQVMLVLRGNGRVTPRLRAVRVYYPRFSYVRRYLPAVYQDDPESAGLTERLLANMEGFNTEIEGKIAHAGLLFDPRTAPPETLDWLAGWLGLMLDPLWARIQAYRQRAGAVGRPPWVTYRFDNVEPAPDRRRLFIRFAPRLYERRGTPTGIRFALHLLLDPCLETMLQALKDGVTRLNPALRDTLHGLGLPYPSPAMSEAALEDLLHDFLLAPRRPSKVRLVEHFQTRDGRALAQGDTTPEGRTRPQTVAALAHRFTVLVPERLSREETAMVERVVRLEKPAHTGFEVALYYDYFRVGEARLGTDSVLGEESRFVAMVLDRDYLAHGYLAPASPMDAVDRLIADRDHLGLRPI
jgi:hypothetical protein